jgi:hypothetical protein
MASGTGHHQCSQKTLKLPWLLSRPVQKTPRTTKTVPTTAPARLRLNLTRTRYPRRTEGACRCPDVDPGDGAATASGAAHSFR